jgi:hypothetical protein
MKSMLQTLSIALLCATAAASADVVDERLAEYQAQGAGGFSASPARSCTACHTADLRSAGKHAETGKRIEPMKPAVNPERLTDARQIEKWFLRNCKWTFGRECTPQEKGDFLMFIRN